MTIDWGFSLAVVVTGLVVVFVVLLLLVLLCTVMGKVFTNIDKKKTQKDKLPADSVKEAPKAAVITKEAIISDGICDDDVAAISAAIAVIMSDGDMQKPFAIKSIKKAKEQRSAWNTAGIIDNTRQY